MTNGIFANKMTSLMSAIATTEVEGHRPYNNQS